MKGPSRRRIFAFWSIILTFAGSTGWAENREWTILSDCRLAEPMRNRADLIQVERGSEVFHFQLYFVEAPPALPAQTEHIDGQARYFGQSWNEVLTVGREALAFTRGFLSGSFEVWTTWENVAGHSDGVFWAMVFRDGLSLQEALVANGLARRYGRAPKQIWSGGDPVFSYWNSLHKLEEAARKKALGGWQQVRPGFDVGAKRAELVRSNIAHLNETGGRERPVVLVDLNRSTYDELINLNGIGPILALRIIRDRPYSRVEDVIRVRGIGERTLDRLRESLVVSP